MSELHKYTWKKHVEKRGEIYTLYTKKLISHVDFVQDKISITSEKPGLGFSIISNYIHRGIPLTKGVRYAVTVYSNLNKKNDFLESLKIKI